MFIPIYNCNIDALLNPLKNGVNDKFEVVFY
jgi:hypothetical protein